MISLAGALLAVTLGAAPALASSVAGGGHGSPAFAAQASPPTLTVTGVSSSEVDLSWTAPPPTTPSTTPPTTPSTTPPTTPSTTPPTSPTTSLTTPPTSPTTQIIAAPAAAPGGAESGDLLVGKYVRSDPAGGYDVYEGTSSGGESLLTGPVTGSTFHATDLHAGTTYYFEVTSVDAAGDQSGLSNEVQATTPTPGAADNTTGVLVGLGVIVAAIVGGLVWWRRRPPRPPGPHPPVIKAVPDAGPPIATSVYAIRTGAMHTVRIEPHPGASMTTMEEVPQ
jgi:uncharacterized iron-regulated membrane protein